MDTGQRNTTYTNPFVKHGSAPGAGAECEDLAPQPRKKDPLATFLGLLAAIAAVWLAVAFQNAVSVVAGIAIVALVFSFTSRGLSSRRVRRAAIGALIGLALVPAAFFAYLFFVFGVMGAQIG